MSVTDSDTLGAEICDWIERTLRVPEGVLIGQPIQLMEWQRDAILKIYDNPRAATRRCIISVGRKSGKTTYAACLLLAHLAGPAAVPNSQLFSAAQSRDQAGLLFALAAKVVRMSPVLSDAVVIKDGTKQLHHPALGTVYRALSADAATNFGLSPTLIIHDELGQVRGPRSELYEALETATAGQLAPLSIIISTQAPTDGDLLSILIDDAMAGYDPRVICSLYTARPQRSQRPEIGMTKIPTEVQKFKGSADGIGLALYT
jgi:phage terminase large subunit-like protein